MLIVAITGGLGAGKSTAAEYFRQRGAVVIDSDDLAAEVLAPGSPVLQAVVDEFGSDILTPEGVLDRARLARLAFSHPASARRLNELTHPAITTRLQDLLGELKDSEPHPPAVIVEVPLLVEAPFVVEMVDLVLAITAPEDVRIARVGARGIQPSDALTRVRNQATDDQRADLADVVLENDGDEAGFRTRLDAFWSSHVDRQDAGA